MVVVLAGLGVLVWLSLEHGTEYEAVVGRLHPNVNDGTVWLFIALGGICLWYHLPLDSLHKAVLIGLVPYLLVYSVVLRAVVALGWESGWVVNRTAPLAYLVLLAYWAYVAWRPTGGDAGTRVGRLLARKEAA
jgi:cell division protein FtsW (lipid II flippase)